MTLTIEGKRIGTGEKAFLIAELSANHDGDLDQALALVDIAADAGWDAFKLQTYSADSLTVNSAHPSLHIDPIWGKPNLYELYADAAMPMEFHKPLFDRARARGMLRSRRFMTRAIWRSPKRWAARSTRLRRSN